MKKKKNPCFWSFDKLNVDLNPLSVLCLFFFFRPPPAFYGVWLGVLLAVCTSGTGSSKPPVLLLFVCLPSAMLPLSCELLLFLPGISSAPESVPLPVVPDVSS